MDEHYSILRDMYMSREASRDGIVLPFRCFLERVLIGCFVLCSDDRLQLNDFLEGVWAAAANGYYL